MFGTLRLLHRVHHGSGFRGIAPQRLFAHHHLAGLRRGDGDLGVRIVGAGDVDQVDILRSTSLRQSVSYRFIAPVLRRTPRTRSVLRAQTAFSTG